MSNQKEKFRILHLSDLHLTAGDDPMNRFAPLAADLFGINGFMKGNDIQCLVVSGDLTNTADPEEFKQAAKLIGLITERFKIARENCIIVPGNHDLLWDENGYKWRMITKEDEVKKLEAGEYFNTGTKNIYLVQDSEKYKERFSNFSEFYKNFFGRPYPLDAKEQAEAFLFEKSGIQFLALNSSWQIDLLFEDRSSIYINALNAALLEKIDTQVEEAITNKKIQQDHSILRIAVWHHPIRGTEQMKNDRVWETLTKNNFKLILHGHVHEDRDETIGHWDKKRQIYIIGAGTFGGPAKARPEAKSRLYNLLEIEPDHSQVKVYTRKKDTEESPWEECTRSVNDTRQPFYVIELKPRSSNP